MPEKHWILAQDANPLTLWSTLRWGAGLLAAMGSVSVVGALSTMPDLAPADRRQVVEAFSVRPQGALPADNLPFVREEQVRAGDSLRSLVHRLGAGREATREDLLAEVRARGGGSQLRVGEPSNAVISPSGDLLSLTLPVGSGAERLRVERSASGFHVFKEAQGLPNGLEMRSGVISASLFASTDAANVPDSVAYQLVELFGTTIDFHGDLRRGDQFRVIFEVAHREGRLASTGRIVAAEFTNQGTTHRVFLFRDAEGRHDYYTDTGESLKQGFLRSPLEFSRVTSGFSLRLHPTLNTWRQHQGVDFGAPTGTAVKATGDGTVEFVGAQNGYGNIVILKHQDGYSTVYGHLSRFARGLRANSSVSQGQVIGYVGQTGWATGPHLHYELRVAGIPRDPLTIALPDAQPVTAREMAHFRATIAPLQERLALLRGSTPSTILQ